MVTIVPAAAECEQTRYTMHAGRPLPQPRVQQQEQQLRGGRR